MRYAVECLNITESEAQAIYDAFRARPEGPHDKRVKEVLNFVRARPVPGKLALLELVRGTSFCLIRLSGQLNVPPRLAHDGVFPTRAAAEVTALLLRLRELGYDVAAA